jgi:xanthine dehydrogenase iron-sulfur cluster and FAD-binding subunit A
MDFLLNGRTVRTEGFPVHSTLLDYLRGNGITGAKEGCAEGECGACAALLVCPDGTGSRLRAVDSCLVLLASLAGQEVFTVEGLARDGHLSEPQRAIAEGGGSQCGYCTPGFVVSLFAEYYRPGRSGPCEPHAMGGNLPLYGYRPLRERALSRRALRSMRSVKGSRIPPRLSRHSRRTEPANASNAPHRSPIALRCSTRTPKRALLPEPRVSVWKRICAASAGPCSSAWKACRN